MTNSTKRPHQGSWDSPYQHMPLRIAMEGDRNRCLSIYKASTKPQMYGKTTIESAIWHFLPINSLIQ